MSAAKKLMDLLAEPRTYFIPTCHDALSARLIQGAGYPLCFISGYGISASYLGMPDVGLITQTEMTDNMRRICAVSPSYPFVADADTGYGNPMNVRRTVEEYARAGVACIMIEDQVSPKKCGHFAGKDVVSAEEARLRIRAAVEARNEGDLDILIMARTDARTVHGFDDALDRCMLFQEEGVDILFMEALETEEEMRTFCNAVDLPTWGNNFAGGKTPYLGRELLGSIGFNVVTDPTLLFSTVHAIKAHLQAHKSDNEHDFPPRVGFDQMKEILDLQNHNMLESRYKLSD